jgi:cephalosporin hydroxylase
LYQIWYGDDYLAQRAKNVYAINSNKIKGKISETLKRFDDPNSEISKRIELDSKNFIRFGHFEDGKNWDIPYQMINKRQAVMGTFQLEYERATKTPSDINENVHLLYELAQQCETVVEMGVRTGVSTRAFLNTRTKLISYDISLDKEVATLFEMARMEGKDAQYIKADVLNIEIAETDLLFIDTLHTYSQLSKELKLHGNKAKKYLAFHDTYTFGLTGEVGNDRKGLMTAIIEFMIQNPHWKFKTHKTNNNGFTILERV